MVQWCDLNAFILSTLKTVIIFGAIQDMAQITVHETNILHCHGPTMWTSSQEARKPGSQDSAAPGDLFQGGGSLCGKLFPKQLQCLNGPKRTIRLADEITLDPHYVLHEQYHLLPSGGRCRVPDC